MTQTKDGAASAAVQSDQAPPSIWQRLREPFPVEKVGKLPKPTIKNEEWKQLPREHCDTCGGYHPATATIHLEYIGHADITDRLLSVDPEWNWEPLASDEDGLPRFTVNERGQHVGLWIRLTVGGVTRLGYGSVEGGAFDAEKQLIGDALRNAAMRFGVALDLWRKEVHPVEGAGGEGAPAPPPVSCPKDGCDGHLRQRQSARGPFLSCSSWKSREQPGCGFKADGTLEAWTAKEHEFAASSDDVAADLPAPLPGGLGPVGQTIALFNRLSMDGEKSRRAWELLGKAGWVRGAGMGAAHQFIPRLDPTRLSALQRGLQELETAEADETPAGDVDPEAIPF